MMLRLIGTDSYRRCRPLLNNFEENKRIYILLVIFLFIFLGIIYFFIFRPLNFETKEKELDILALENDISVLEIEIENLKQVGTDESEFVNQIPFSKNIDDLVLTFREIEENNDVMIDEIHFRYETDLPALDIEEVDEEVEAEDEEAGEEEVEEDEARIQTILPIEERPEELQTLHVHMNIYAPNFDRFKQFVQEIEEIERIVLLSKIDFTRDAESLAEEPFEDFNFAIDLITFYYEK